MNFEKTLTEETKETLLGKFATLPEKIKSGVRLSLIFSLLTFGGGVLPKTVEAGGYKPSEQQQESLEQFYEREDEEMKELRKKAEQERLQKFFEVQTAEGNLGKIWFEAIRGIKPAMHPDSKEFMDFYINISKAVGSYYETIFKMLSEKNLLTEKDEKKVSEWSEWDKKSQPPEEAGIPRNKFYEFALTEVVNKGPLSNTMRGYLKEIDENYDLNKFYTGLNETYKQTLEDIQEELEKATTKN